MTPDKTDYSPVLTRRTGLAVATNISKNNCRQAATNQFLDKLCNCDKHESNQYLKSITVEFSFHHILKLEIKEKNLWHIFSMPE